jgi:hypothetical protein
MESVTINQLTIDLNSLDPDVGITEKPAPRSAPTRTCASSAFPGQSNW